VHALDTERRTAVCIDLEDLRRSIWGATLQLHGPRLDVVGRAGTVLARIDTRINRLVRRRQAEPGDAGTSWLPMLAPTAVLALLLALGRRRRIARLA
jgi:hypothetical protein